MREEDYKTLYSDIKDNGYDKSQPIFTYKDRILDGWNRYKICEELNIKPIYNIFKGKDFEAIQFVMRTNKRRNLTSSQWACIAIEAEEIYQAIKKEAKERQGARNDLNIPELIPESKEAREQIADLFNTNAHYINDAQKYKTEKPEVFEQIKTGEKTITEVKKEQNHKVKKDREKKELDKNKFIDPVIIKADCLSVIDNIKLIDLLIADPPYFTDGDFTNHVSLYLKKVKPTGQAYIFMSADPNELKAYLNIDSGDMKLEQILVWNYNNTGQRQPNVRYNSNYQLYFYYRGINAPNINKPADGKEQYACQTINAPDARQGDRYFNWQKPIDLIDRLIRNSSKPKDFIFDPFAGSGTTLVSAGKLGREAQGCEIEDEQIKICLDRGCKI